jgi:hypothetical protein
MAAYQGARRRAHLPLGLDALTGSARGTDAGARPAADHDAHATSPHHALGRSAGARHSASAVRERSRPPAVGLAIAAIVIVFGAAFLSLSQSVRVAATGYDIVRLASEHDRLQAIRQDLQSDVTRLWSEPAIRKQALDNGLGQLGAPILVPAR